MTAHKSRSWFACLRLAHSGRLSVTAFIGRPAMFAFGSKADITATGRNFNLRLPQKLRHGDVPCDPRASSLLSHFAAQRRPALQSILFCGADLGPAKPHNANAYI
jgi:hypothetical protein